jgi:hypothetical protein
MLGRLSHTQTGQKWVWGFGLAQLPKQAFDRVDDAVDFAAD